MGPSLFLARLCSEVASDLDDERACLGTIGRLGRLKRHDAPLPMDKAQQRCMSVELGIDVVGDQVPRCGRPGKPWVIGLVRSRCWPSQPPRPWPEEDEDGNEEVTASEPPTL